MKTLYTITLALLFALLSLAAGCNTTPDAPAAGGKAGGKDVIRVAATTGMIADIVREVGGDRVEVTALMGPGTDPHYYKPTAGDIETLTNADIIFYNGLELEGRMTQTFEKLAANGKRTIAVGEAVPVEMRRQPREFQGRYDPHIWFDVTLWQMAAKKAAEELTAFDSANADVYKRNAEAYDTRLDELHAFAKTEIARIPPEQRILITAHDAFGYFGRQYGMEVRGIQGTSTTTEAGVKDIQTLVDLIAKRKIKAIFVESSVPAATIEAVQKAVTAKGGQVKIGGSLFSDAMGANGTPEGTYIGMVRHNVNVIVEALK